MSDRRKRMARAAAVILVSLFSIAYAYAQDERPLRILLSNDDGYEAPGIIALQAKLAQFAQVVVSAPSRNQSLVGHGMTYQLPIVAREIERAGSKWFIVDALPGTCIKLGLETFLEERPDLVVSGINRGDNLGTMHFSSGTVACAREAAYKGIPAVAANLDSGPSMDYELAAEFVAALVKELKAKGLRPGVYLNVNIPALPRDKILGVRVVKQDTRPYPDYKYRKYNIEKSIFIWYDFLTIDKVDSGEPTDVEAMKSGCITITPLQFDATDRDALEMLGTWSIKDWK